MKVLAGGQEVVLQTPESKLRNMKTDIPRAKDRASAVLEIWGDMKGRDATVGYLLDAFERIDQRRIME